MINYSFGKTSLSIKQSYFTLQLMGSFLPTKCLWQIPLLFNYCSTSKYITPYNILYSIINCTTSMVNQQPKHHGYKTSNYSRSSIILQSQQKKSKLFYLDLLRLQQTMWNNLIAASNKLWKWATIVNCKRKFDLMKYIIANC